MHEVDEYNSYIRKTEARKRLEQFSRSIIFSYLILGTSAQNNQIEH